MLTPTCPGPSEHLLRLRIVDELLDPLRRGELLLGLVEVHVLRVEELLLLHLRYGHLPVADRRPAGDRLPPGYRDPVARRVVRLHGGGAGAPLLVLRLIMSCRKGRIGPMGRSIRTGRFGGNARWSAGGVWVWNGY